MLEIIVAVTTHFLPGEWTERHIGLRYEQGHFMSALFLNSEGNPSLAVGLYGEHRLSDGVSLFGEIGGATGYSGGPVVPFARGGFEFGDRVRFFVAPAMNTDGDFGAVLGVEAVILQF